MATKIAPASRELREYYSERSGWRHRGEERMRFERAAAVARVRPGTSVLDIGARDGGLRAHLPAGVRYQGMDIAAEFARDDIVIRDIALGIPFPDASYDTVFSIEVLEHVHNPWGAISEIHRVLRPGGVWVVSVPNPYHLKEIIWNLFQIPDRQGHIYAWTRQTMTRLAQMNGFRLEGTAGTYFHPPIPAPTLLARSIVYRFVKD